MFLFDYEYTLRGNVYILCCKQAALNMYVTHNLKCIITGWLFDTFFVLKWSV